MFLKKTTEIPISEIRAGDQQPRQRFDENQLVELRDSIRQFGILQPLILKKEADGGYQLIAGERRLRAASMAGLSKVPVIIKETTEEEAGMIALVENIQRENLGYIEEAKAYRSLMERYGFSQLALSERLGKNQSTISNKLRILHLPEDIQHLLVENKLTERHARALLRVGDDSQRRLIIEKVIKHQFNVKQTEKLVEEWLNKREDQERERNKVRHISYKLYINTLKKAFSDMNLAGQGGAFQQEDLGDALLIKITIPKELEDSANERQDKEKLLVASG